MNNLGLIITIIIFGSLINNEFSVKAQLIPDNTLGNKNSKVNSENLIDVIEGGVISQSNLFHSFQEFNINNGQQVYFANPQGVNNIFTRVTGNNLSRILGTLGINGNANLFLLNPNGFIFGKGATLNLNGSFTATTANAISFGEQNVFSAKNPSRVPLLSINVPLGLQYGTDTNTGAIEVNQATLEVKSEQTLRLIGGEINLREAILAAPSGNIVLQGLQGEGNILLSHEPLNIVENGFAKSDLTISQNSLINVKSIGGGNINITANNVSLIDSELRAGIIENTDNPLARGGKIEIQVRENINIHNSLIDGVVENNSQGDGGDIFLRGNNIFFRDSNLLNNTNGFGDAGNVNIQAHNEFNFVSSPMNLTFGAQGRKIIASGVAPKGKGNGGNILVTAKDITVSGIGGISSGISGTGNGGTITIASDRLKVIEGAIIGTNTTGLGNAGNISIQARELMEIDNQITPPQFREVARPPGGIIADIRRDATGEGNGGNITINTGNLMVKNGALITTDTKGLGDAGNIDIFARESLIVTGRDNNSGQNQASQIVSAVRRNAPGEGGDIRIETKQLIVSDGGIINVGTEATGNSGNLVIKAIDFIQIKGTVDNLSSIILAQVGDSGSGEGGDISIETGKLTIKDGGRISSGNLGNGKAGNISLLVTDTINISGFSFVNGDDTEAILPSGIFTKSPGMGDAGNLIIKTNKLNLSNLAQISVSSQNTGNAGSLSIEANRINLQNSILSAETVAGQEGNINLQSVGINIKDKSLITTNATQGATGGNIDISTGVLIASGNSDITANAEDSFAGRVVINAQGIFGLQFREFLTSQSDITATSSLGAEFNGIVQINNPDVDPTSAFTNISVQPEDVSQKVVAKCSADNGNSFVRKGKGGLPSNPTQRIDSQLIWEDTRDQVQDSQINLYKPVNSVKLTSSSPKITQIIPAQGWIVQDNGTIVLINNEVEKKTLSPRLISQCASKI